MPQSKEQLNELLKIIDRLANEKGNEEFREKLQYKYGQKFIAVSSTVEDKINSILGLLELEGLKLINYDNVLKKEVKHQLKVDSLMMAKHRVGSINNPPNFEEYCRYAHLQSEELINYFFSERGKSNIENIIAEILLFNPEAQIKNPRNVGEINYIYKLFSISAMRLINEEHYKEFSLLNGVRNKLSHRNTSFTTPKIEVDNYLKNKDYNQLFFSLEFLKESLLENLDKKIQPPIRKNHHSSKNFFNQSSHLQNIKTQLQNK